MKNKPGSSTAPPHPFSCLPRLAQLEDHSPPPAPDDNECFRLWRKYEMLPNIEAHSLMVAKIATALAHQSASLGMNIDVAATRASALLHDIAKTYCVRHGGGHAMLGAAWMLAETGHYPLAQGIILHVHWPWALPQGAAICCLPIFVMYADKRVRHDACVTLQERFEDLLLRYGRTEAARAGIKNSMLQAQHVENLLSEQLGIKLNENSFDSGWLVH